MSVAFPDIGRSWRLALFGSKGMLARKVIELAPQKVVITGYDLPECDITDSTQLTDVLDALQPDIIINCAGFTAVDACEEQEDKALAINGLAVGNLAKMAEKLGALLVHLSTDYVFDGMSDTPYSEDDLVRPLSAYGRTKLAGEKAIIESDLDRFLIVRTSWLYGPGGKNFVETILRLATERDELRVVADQVGCPTYTGDLAQAIYFLLNAALRAENEDKKEAFGIYHFSSSDQCSWYELASSAVAMAKEMGQTLKTERVLPIRTEEYTLPAPRPAFSVFSKQKYEEVTGRTAPSWRASLQDYLEENCSS